MHAVVRDLATPLAFIGCTVITGGGPGLMEAANERAALAGATASNVGIRVLPFEQEVNPFVDESLCFHLLPIGLDGWNRYQRLEDH